MRRTNIQHGQARRRPMSWVWPVLAGIVIGGSLPFLAFILWGGL